MEIVDQVRQAANIVEIASQYTTLRARGRKHVGLCPFPFGKNSLVHGRFREEPVPLLRLRRRRGRFHPHHGKGEPVLSRGAQDARGPISYRPSRAAPGIAPGPEARGAGPEINDAALAYFKKNLAQTAEGKKAQEYLKKRGIPEAVIEEFKLGYALNTWDALTAFFKAKGTAPSLLEKAGLAVPGRKGGEFYDPLPWEAHLPHFRPDGQGRRLRGPVAFRPRPQVPQLPRDSGVCQGADALRPQL